MKPQADDSQRQRKETNPAKKSFFAELKRFKLLFPYTKGNRKLLMLPALLIPLIAGLQIATPQILKSAIDDGVIPKDYDHLVTYAFLFLLVTVLSYLARTSQAIASIVFVQRMIFSIRDDLVSHVLKLKAKYHDKNMGGALVTRATSDFDNLSESLNFGVLNTMVDLAVLVGNIVGMFLLDWRLAIVASLTLPVVIFAIKWFSSTLKHHTLITRKKIAALNAYTQESLYGNATIKLLTAEKEVSDKHAKMNISYRNSQMKIVALDAGLFSVIDGVSSVTIGLVLYAALSDLGLGSGLTAGVIVAFVQLIQQLFDPLKQLGSTMAMLQGVFTAIDRIFGILTHKEFISGNDLGKLSGKVKFENVSFRYDGSSGGKTLKSITFAVEMGESVAIVGSTGSGKSTIIKLLSKLYDDYQGSIKVGHSELSDIKAEVVRSNISIVPQDIALFDGTVSFNIGLGDDNVTQAEIERAAKIVGADKFIRRLTGKYDHKISERGENLSHGQRQLIAFARALCKEPDYVILDEATSSVDPSSERLIQEAMHEILKSKTVIVIAHRLSTVKECDKIIVLEEGTIVETGPHLELLSRKGRYSELINQFSRPREANSNL